MKFGWVKKNEETQRKTLVLCAFSVISQYRRRPLLLRPQNPPLLCFHSKSSKSLSPSHSNVLQNNILESRCFLGFVVSLLLPFSAFILRPKTLEERLLPRYNGLQWPVRRNPRGTDSWPFPTYTIHTMRISQIFSTASSPNNECKTMWYHFEQANALANNSRWNLSYK